jgi:hypothetical protein
MTLATGVLLNQRYRINRPLGQGGFGAVYEAWDNSLNQPCAIKENLDTSPEAQRQFQREASMMAGLRHTNLPRVIDHFYVPGQGQYLVMDFVAGQSLEKLLAQREGPLNEREVLNWLEQVCDALAYLHNCTPPIIHRDIKPENVIVTPEGRAMLVDFGISKVYDPNLATTMGAKAITPGYSPPEQYGGGITDARADIYALGATLYTLLTGQRPPESVQRVAGLAVLAQPRQMNPYIRPAVENVIIKSLDVTTSKRFQSIGELRTALHQPDGAQTIALPITGTAGRSTRQWLLIAVVALALLGLIALGSLLGSRLIAAQNQADTPAPTALAAISAETATALAAELSAGVTTSTATAPPTQLLVATATAVDIQAEVNAALTRVAEEQPTHTPTAEPTSTPTETATTTMTAAPLCPSVTGTFAAVWSNVQTDVGCAESTAFSGLIVEENFVSGKMFWREPIDYAQALVVFNNGTWQIFQHAPYVDGSPEYPCADANTPAQSPPTPRRGFGTMWCDIPAIRNGLGNATDVERGYTGTMQQFENGFMIHTDYGATFIFYNSGLWERQ